MTTETAITKLRNAALLISEAVNELSSLLESSGTEEESASLDESQSAVSDESNAPAVPAEQKLTLEDVRGVLADIARCGNREGVKTLLEKYGASKLSAIDPKDYASLLKDAEELKNA